MKHKLLGYVLIVSAVLSCAVVTPQALAEKPQSKASKTITNKDHNQTGQLQITGTPGSPGATTTISGKQLPAPEPKFGGVIKDACPAIETMVGAAHRAAQGSAQRVAHHHG